MIDVDDDMTDDVLVDFVELNDFVVLINIYIFTTNILEYNINNCNVFLDNRMLYYKLSLKIILRQNKNNTKHIKI